MHNMLMLNMIDIYIYIYTTKDNIKEIQNNTYQNIIHTNTLNNTNKFIIGCSNTLRTRNYRLISYIDYRLIGEKNLIYK